MFAKLHFSRELNELLWSFSQPFAARDLNELVQISYLMESIRDWFTTRIYSELKHLITIFIEFNKQVFDFQSANNLLFIRVLRKSVSRQNSIEFKKNASVECAARRLVQKLFLFDFQTINFSFIFAGGVAYCYSIIIGIFCATRCIKYSRPTVRQYLDIIIAIVEYW